MKVNGYKIREALRNWKTMRDVHAARFNDSLFSFDENATTPQKVAEAFQKADRAVAVLEEAQQFYNSQVRFRVGKETITLALAVKLVGGAGRIEKMWRSAAKDNGRDRYSYRELTRKADEIHAKRMVSPDECIRLAAECAVFASELRNGIAEGCSREVEIELSPDLFSRE